MAWRHARVCVCEGFLVWSGGRGWGGGGRPLTDIVRVKKRALSPHVAALWGPKLQICKLYFYNAE